MTVENIDITNGFVNAEIDKNINIINELNKLKKEKGVGSQQNR